MVGGVDDREPLLGDADAPAERRERVLQVLVPADEIHAEAHRRGPDSRLTLLIAGTAVLGAALVLAREATYGVWLECEHLLYKGCKL